MLTNISRVFGNNSILNEEKAMHVSRMLTLEVGLEKDKYAVDEPIVVQCTVTNISQDMINLKPVLFMDLVIYLKYEDGKNVAPFGPKILLRELLQKGDIIELLPGKSFSYKRTINNKTYFMPTSIGKYELYAVYQNGMDDLGKIRLWTGELKSNIVKFEIIK